MLFADTNQTTSAAVWLTGAFAAAGGISTLINLAALFATRREVEALEKRLEATNRKVEAVTTELVEMERRITAGGEDRAGALHSRINDILSAVANLGGRFDQSQRH